MKIKLRLRNILLLFGLVQSLGAFASGNGKQPKEDKPDKPLKTVGLPTHSISLENGMPSNTASKAMLVQNAQLSNALDKAVAQMGDVMALMDYSEFPAERAEVLVDASTNNDRENCCRTMAGRETQPRDTEGYQPRSKLYFLSSSGTTDI